MATKKELIQSILTSVAKLQSAGVGEDDSDKPDELKDCLSEIDDLLGEAVDLAAGKEL